MSLRVTKTVAGVVLTLDKAGKWISVPELAEALETPRQNLHYALRRLTEEKVVERHPDMYPVHVRLKKGQRVADILKTAKAMLG